MPKPIPVASVLHKEHQMNGLNGFSDDQVALIGCLVALVSSAGLMYLSFFVGPASRRETQEPAVTKLPQRPAVNTPHERAA